MDAEGHVNSQRCPGKWTGVIFNLIKIQKSCLFSVSEWKNVYNLMSWNIELCGSRQAGAFSEG